MIDTISILYRNGRQYIPDLRKAGLQPPFRGRPVISDISVDEQLLASVCPSGAIGAAPVSLDLGKCLYCGECALSFPEKISFTSDHLIASNLRDRLIVKHGDREHITVDPRLVRNEIRTIYGSSLKLRQVSAGGDGSAELELNACGNVNFDMGRFGIEFVASPRHADGIVITGPVTASMSGPLEKCFRAIADPKIIILAGTDAISGGIFRGSPSLNRSFLERNMVDLYVPGNPPHPLTFINGVMDLMGMS